MTISSNWKQKIARTTAIGLTVASVALGGVSTGHAQGDGQPPATISGLSLSDYLGSHEYWSRLKSFTERFDGALGPCPSAELNKRIKAVPAKYPFSVPRLGTPPQWIEILQIDGCTKPFQRQVVVFYVNGKTQFMPLMAGTTRADPFLQADVLKVLLPAARAKASKMRCQNAKNVRLLGTRYDAQTGEFEGQGWKETWRVFDCHGSHDYSVRFTTSSRGGTSFRISEV
ncbi:MAG: hypothetical protein AAF468_16620 [Pseudomonadota bacterium]